MERPGGPVWAVVDIGSNSLRLVVYRVESTGFLTLLTNLKHVVRLSEHVDTKGYLTPKAISILGDTLQAFQAALPVWEPQRVDVVATAPLRYARNQTAIIEALRKRLGWTVRILHGEEEARYAFLAAAHTTYVEDGVAVDMGGGSTELALYRQRRCIARASLPFGALMLAQRFPTEEKLSAVEREEVLSFLQQIWQQVPWLEGCQLPVIGIGGTVRALGKTYLRSCASPVVDTHQGTIPRPLILEWADRISSLSVRGRRRDLSLPRGRAIIAAPASLALGSLLRYMDAGSLVICRGGLREGMLYGRLQAESDARGKPGVSPAQRSLAEAVRRHGGCGPTSPLAVVADLLASRLAEAGWAVLEEKDREQIVQAASLVPRYESDRRDSSRFLQMLNWSWDGLPHLEQCQLLWLASPGDPYWRLHRAWWNRVVGSAQRARLQQLAAIISLARALTWTHRSIVKEIRCEKEGKECRLRVFWTGNSFLEKQRCDVAKRHLERALRRTFALHFEE